MEDGDVFTPDQHVEVLTEANLGLLGVVRILREKIVQLEAEAVAQSAQMARAYRELADLARAAKDQSEIAYNKGDEDGYERGYEDALRKMAAE